MYRGKNVRRPLFILYIFCTPFLHFWGRFANPFIFIKNEEKMDRGKNVRRVKGMLDVMNFANVN